MRTKQHPETGATLYWRKTTDGSFADSGYEWHDLDGNVYEATTDEVNDYVNRGTPRKD